MKENQLQFSIRLGSENGKLKNWKSKQSTRGGGGELETMNQELKTIDENHKRGRKRLRDQETELTKIKKQQETLSERKKAIEKDMQVVVTADKSLNQIIKDKEGKRTKLSEELKTLEDDLEEYACQDHQEHPRKDWTRAKEEGEG